MFEHHENDDFEEYIKERKKGTTETDVEQRIEERAKRRRGKLNGFLCFIAGMAVSFVLVYVGFVIALNKGGFTHIFTSGNGSKLDYKKIEEKTSLLQSIIDKYFLFDEDMTKVEDGIYAGMMNGLDDPYTVYYTKEEYKALNEEVNTQV